MRFCIRILASYWRREWSASIILPKTMPDIWIYLGSCKLMIQRITWRVITGGRPQTTYTLNWIVNPR